MRVPTGLGIASAATTSNLATKALDSSFGNGSAEQGHIQIPYPTHPPEHVVKALLEVSVEDHSDVLQPDIQETLSIHLGLPGLSGI